MEVGSETANDIEIQVYNKTRYETQGIREKNDPVLDIAHFLP